MSAEPAFRFAVVCEAAADQETACDLADRVLKESADWISDSGLNALRRWCGIIPETTHVTWKTVPTLARERSIRMAHGHFDNVPAKDDARPARRAIWLFRSLDEPPDALLLIRDSDKSGERLSGLRQAREELSDPQERQRIVIGVAITKRECWVLNGFEPKEQTETRLLRDMKLHLGFDPTTNGHRLTAGRKEHKRNAKRVLEKLTRGDRPRERRCWRETPLESLRAKGEKTGLRDYLDEVQERLVPIVAGTPRKQTSGRTRRPSSRRRA